MTYLEQPLNRHFNSDICKIAKTVNHIYFYSEFDISYFSEIYHAKGICNTACWAKKIAELVTEKYPYIIGKRTWKGIKWKNEIDIEIQVEIQKDNLLLPIAVICRNVAKMELKALDAEIKKSRNSCYPNDSAFLYLPSLFRILLFKLIRRNLQLFSKYFGNISLTSIGSIGSNCGYVHPLTITPFCVALGSKYKDGDRVMQKVTFVFDHDLIDGSNCARFIDDLQNLVKG